MKKKILRVLNYNFKNSITCLTAYSPAIAKILDGNVNIILVGDSLGTTLYGMNNCRNVTLDMMKIHGKAVIKNIKKSITVVDMPYKSYTNSEAALKNAKSLLSFTKANMLKLEINKKNIPLVKYLTSKNINVVSHIGVTPQSFSDFSKIKAVGRTEKESNDLLNLAKKSENLGAKIILLECVTQKTAKKITENVSVPTIGIGSSKYCDGQVLVFDDLIGFDSSKFNPRFVKRYMNFDKQAKTAVKKFTKDVKRKKFPSKKNSYH